jgi:hypothetical protein
MSRILIPFASLALLALVGCDGLLAEDLDAEEQIAEDPGKGDSFLSYPQGEFFAAPGAGDFEALRLGPGLVYTRTAPSVEQGGRYLLTTGLLSGRRFIHFFDDRGGLRDQYEYVYDRPASELHLRRLHTSAWFVMTGEVSHCSSLGEQACATRSDCEWSTDWDAFPGPISICVPTE